MLREIARLALFELGLLLRLVTRLFPLPSAGAASATEFFEFSDGWN